ncbi:MAG TPA: hypothetical protein VG796_28040 [Verrucomicrobiales bacterium]|nr:hypothetical protein [Verrucomicrobiales bacterium]
MNVAEILHPPDITGSVALPRKRRWRVACVAGAAIVAAVVLVLVLQHFRSAGTDSSPTPEQDRAAARQVLSDFLAASTAEQRAECVIGGDQLLPLMQAYYAGREVEPLSAGDFQPASWSFDTKDRGLLAFELPRGRSLPTVVACLKKSDTGQWLMDWDVWTQTLDGRFRDFINRPAEGQHTLRVRLTSTAASPDEVKLQVADPFNTASSMTFEVTRADLTALYCADLPAGVTRTATVQLVWLNDSLTGTLQPVLRRHVCWGFQDLDGVEAAEREPARARKHHQPVERPAEPLVVRVTDSAVETAIISSSAPILQPEPKPPALEPKTVSTRKAPRARTR